MQWEYIQIHWLQYRPLAKRRWLALSDEQLEIINGRRQLLSTNLQRSYGVTREIAELQIETWCTTFDDEEQESPPIKPAPAGAPLSGTALAGAALAQRPLPDASGMRRRTPPRR